MDAADVTELHFIAPFENLPRILERGILSKRLADRYEHVSIADPKVQELRAPRRVPGGRHLHSYANLYVTARNPMLFKRIGTDSLCVLRVGLEVMAIEGAVVTDGNAASDYTRFGPASAGFGIVDLEATFAEYWTDSNPFEGWAKKRKKCAEVLVPNRVPASHIVGACVCCEGALAELAAVAPDLHGTTNSELFFGRCSQHG